ncbi:YcxB family protein [Leptospira sp. GIMC2001]|uniref:YcxB family protein n=1 Tax=Leptospira sp. GIMC2001 TaxID=1513297 RepID=UPI00234B7831|nr:YcxB family protein [Leptospira sp. GIMC2001]WCL50715.1 YcxB family protein [Leptospira sp. GIMC2001]
MIKIIKLTIAFSILIITLNVFKNSAVEDLESNYFTFTILIIIIFSTTIYLYKYLDKERIRFKKQYRILLKKNLIDKGLNENILCKFKISIDYNDIKFFQKYLVQNLPKFINIITFILYISLFILIFNFLVSSLMDISYVWDNLNYGLFSFIILVYFVINELFSKNSNQEKYSSFIGIGEFDFNISNIGIERSNLYFKSFYKWECIESCVISEEYLFFMFSKYEGLIIPLNQISAQKQDELNSIIKISFE